MGRPKTLKSSPEANGQHTGAIDLTELYAAETIESILYDPRYPGARRDTAIRIGVRSIYSNEAREAAKNATARLTIGDDGEVTNDAITVNENLVEQTIGATAYWYLADLSKPRRADGTWERLEGFESALRVDGQALPCTPENVRRLYTTPRTRWIQRAVEKDYLSVSRFFDAPRTDS